ncbi:MAG: S8/S53 family peptidase [Pseudomonadota bacterium]|jgi:hypothetical protein|uniref:subtilisin-like serine protease QhpE n=1 Tax=Stutzerimonas TaxID=2901164 RepID=UPI0005973B76|nr:S8/S53 family peptidase [Stutzerimonas kunmingensis]KIL02715.1 peptidase S8 and S53 subtilisin kexin sedolisin [Stutzerimonas stutzeri]MBD3877375.1 S8/S53 family peptidase [Stutzerimonas kunmingensis]HAV05795.1 peptidase S8 and S53 subtilisin kexin sedolisin [Pseudomonas sp.]
MNGTLRIGVVDSGHAPAQASFVHAARRFWLEDELLCEGPLAPDSLGHGAAVVDRLLQPAVPVTLCLAQVFGARGQTSALQVAAAIYWLVEQQVSLINLSLGLRQDRSSLRLACAAAAEAGILLCASSPARGEPVFPASYPQVVRVTGDARCSLGQWSWLDSAQADFGAAPHALNGTAGASLACAALSGQVTAFLHEHPGAGREAVLEHLRRNASFIGPERLGRKA